VCTFVVYFIDVRLLKFSITVNVFQSLCMVENCDDPSGM